MDARTFAKKKIAEAIHHFHFFFNLTRHLFSAITITQREKWRLSPKNPEAAAAAGCRAAPWRRHLRVRARASSLWLPASLAVRRHSS